MPGRSEEYAEQLALTVREPLLVLNQNLQVITASGAFYRTFLLTREQCQGRTVFALDNSQWDIPDLRRLLETLLLEQDVIEDFEVRHHFQSVGEKIMRMNARRIASADGRPGLILLAIEDLTRRREQTGENSETRYRLLFENMSEGFALAEMIWDDQGNPVDWRYLEVNQAWTQTGIPPGETVGRTAREVNPLIESYWIETYGGVVQTGQSVSFENYAAGFGKWFATFAFKHSANCFGVLFIDITERKRVEKALQESEGRLQRILETEAVGVVFWDEKGRLAGANDTFLQMLGYSREILERKELSWRSMTTPGGIGESERQLERLAQTGRIGPYEKECLRQDGSRIWLRFAGQSLDQGSVEFCMDVSERKRVEEDLKIERGRLQATLESIPDEMWVTDAEGNIIERNARSIQASLGKSDWPDVASALRELEMLNPDGTRRASEDAPLPRALRGDIVRNDPEMIRNLKTGELRWREVSSSPIRDDRGTIIGAVAVARDITERRRAEEALQKSEAHLQEAHDLARESEQRLRLFIEHAPVALAMFDRDMRYQCISRRWSQMYSLDDRNLIGKLHYEIFPGIPERWREAHRRGLAGEVLREEADIFEQSDGSQKWVRWEVRPWKNHTGKIGGIVLFTEDVTERKQQELEIKALNEELEQKVKERTRELVKTQHQYLHAEKLAALGKLAASIAHEVNNPLQAIMTILQGVKKSSYDESDRKMLEIAIGEGNRVKKLIRNLQDFYRPSAERKIPTDLHQTLDGLLLLLHSDFKKKKVAVERHYADHLPQVLVVPDQIKQVFINLLTNAAEACIEGGGLISITTRPEGEDRVSVTVSDNGSGIRPENMDNIFRPFFTTKSAVKGTGLGLSVAYGIVKKHGGELLVESQPGEGTIFTVLLPIAAMAEEEGAPSASP